MQLHGLCGDFRCNQEVLDLLVHHDEPEDEQALDRRVDHGEQQW